MTLRILHYLDQFNNRDERGAALAEYGLLLSFVALVVISVLIVFGGTLAEFFGFATEVFDNSPAYANNETEAGE